MKKTFSAILLLFIISNSFSQKVDKKSESKWINTINIDFNTNEESGAYHYLLLDYQDNLTTQEMYAHFGVKVLNSEGIQEFSDISISFDPSYQILSFNKINIIRNGEIINRLPESNIKTFQRESDLERSLYDGSLTAVVNLKDIRKDDVIEYAYTIKGFNPVNEGNYSTLVYQQYTAPVNTIYNRIVTNKNLPIYTKQLNDADNPITISTSFGEEYIWKSNGSKFYEYDVNTPYWLNFQKRVSVSTFKNWSVLANLLSPYYAISNNNLSIPEVTSTKSIDKEDTILKLIRFVQDDVRYLGFESGIGAYKPNQPKKVLQQRYGDCKDKSLLLVSLLQQNDITSYPFLVSTDSKEDFNGLLPGLNLFNHCIVYFEYEGQKYYVDPTMTNQGGNLKHLVFPNYSKGLILKPNVNKLTSITKNKNFTSLKIEETITTDSIGGAAIFLIKSTYTGSKADYMRDYFNSNTKESINKEFVNFYSAIYPSISNSQPLRFSDNNRNNTNEFVVEEYYNVDDFWTLDETTNYYVCETQPVVLESLINYTNSPKRNLSYYLGNPHDFKQITTIKLPEDWNIKETAFNIDKESFSYSNKVDAIGKTIRVTHDYHLKQETIPAEKVSDFLSAHDKINNQIAYQITYSNDKKEDISQIPWLSISILIIVLIIFLFASKKLYEEYNPPALKDATNLTIGGWLILPTIGLVLSPVIMIFQLISGGYFESYTWTAFADAGYANAISMTIFLGVELVINIGFLVFTILLIILLFNKRTSFPKLILAFYAFNVIFPILDLVAYEVIFPEELVSQDDNNETLKDIFKACIGAAIWIPYFLKSERVANTFTKLYSQNNKDYLAITKTK